jgi:glycerol kinase
MSVFLALDQGTTSTRALLVNGDGAASIVFSAAHQQHFSGTDRVEHDPEELLANLRAALAAAGDVTAIGSIQPG